VIGQHKVLLIGASDVDSVDMSNSDRTCPSLAPPLSHRTTLQITVRSVSTVRGRQIPQKSGDWRTVRTHDTSRPSADNLPISPAKTEWRTCGRKNPDLFGSAGNTATRGSTNVISSSI
jgi:hypothetical protein